MNRGLEFKVGLTVLAAIAIAIAGIVWLKEMTVHAKKRVYLVTFPNTGGLAASDEVQVNGMREGQVRGMRLDQDRVIVELELDNAVLLTRDSRVAIRDVGMMGEKVIAIELRQTGGTYATTDTVQGIYEPGMSEVMGRIGNSVEAVTALVEDLHDVTQQLKGGGQLAKTMQDFAATSHELRTLVSENRAALSATLQNFSDASKTAKSLTTDRQAQLGKAMDSFSSAAEKMDQLSGRLDSLRASAQTLTSRVNAGDGTLGRLVNDQRLYDDLSSSVSSLKGLIEDIKKNPKKYFKVSVF